MSSIETDTQNKSIPSRISTALIGSFFLRIMELLDQLLIFLSLRNKRQFWGVIYDSVTKQPLDPAIVKMVYVDNGHVVQTCVTDLEGRYGFLARPGRFKIFAQKTNYKFPSEIISGYSDGIYDDLYHGEFFTLTDEMEVVAPNIPMDPINPDWNQQAKTSVIGSNPYRNYLVRRIIEVYFWFGFVFVLVNLVWNPQVWAYAAWFLYLLLFVLAYVVPRARLWGVVIDGKTGKPHPHILLELVIPSLNNMVLAKTITLENGKFFLRANNGKYLLIAKELVNGLPVRVLGSTPLTIHSNRVLNSKIIIHKEL